MHQFINSLLRYVGACLVIVSAGVYAGESSPSKRQVITFAAATFAEPLRGEKLRAWVEQFNQSQNQIEIQPVSIPFSSYARTILTQIGANGGPDIIRMDSPEFFTLAHGNRLTPLDTIIDENKYRFADYDRYMKINGTRYGVIFEVANYALVYNKGLIKDPPKSFQELINTAKAATTGGNFGYAYRATLAESNGFWYDLSNFVYGFGGRWTDEQGNPTLNSPQVIEGVAAYKTMYDAEVIPKGTDAATYRRMFVEGKIAMMVDNGGVAANLSSSNSNLSAATSPFPNRSQFMVMAPVAINANSKHQEGAATFIQWMLTPSAQQSLRELLGGASIATNIPRTSDELTASPWVTVYDEQSPYSFPPVPLGLETKAAEIQKIIIDQVIKVLQANEDPAKAMQDAQDRVISRVLRR